MLKINENGSCSTSQSVQITPLDMDIWDKCYAKYNVYNFNHLKPSKYKSCLSFLCLHYHTNSLTQYTMFNNILLPLVYTCSDFSWKSTSIAHGILCGPSKKVCTSLVNHSKHIISSFQDHDHNIFTYKTLTFSIYMTQLSLFNWHYLCMYSKQNYDIFHVHDKIISLLLTFYIHGSANTSYSFLLLQEVLLAMCFIFLTVVWWPPSC